jgi:hypothetical protein
MELNKKNKLSISVQILNPPDFYIFETDQHISDEDLKKQILVKNAKDKNEKKNSFRFIIYSRKKESCHVTLQHIDEYNKLKNAALFNPFLNLNHLSISFAEFNYIECDITATKALYPKICYPKRTAKNIFVFRILSQSQTCTKICMTQPRMLNWGFGPSGPSIYYSLYKDGSLAIHDTSEIDNSSLIETFGFKDGLNLFANYDFEGVTDDRVLWTISDLECSICFEKNSLKPLVIQYPCEHVSICVDCSKKISVCCVCNQKVRFDLLPSKIFKSLT